ncbi:MAG TPA: 6-pyruvoyl-tetrahydropterin synthase-related protein [Pyrinomonadaceae bacterium]|nr:6-pyruvoyl-tetrahydropterin synthase-related protein [Pyrinomonadaceae bacterium]
MQQRYWLQVVAIGLLASFALYLYGVPYGLDLPHHFRLAQGFFESIKAGDFYPSWLASTNQGYGDPSVRFYPPALYYLLSFFRLITGDWYFATLLTLSLLTLIGCLGMYLWAGSLTDQSYAVLAALLYTLAPFHANEIYQAGMYPQYACASVLPFVFAFIERIFARNRWRDVGGLGLSYGLLILFHLPLALLGSLAVSIYALIRLIQSFSRRSLYQLTAGALSGLALSCCYWLPMLLELDWKRPGGSGQDKWFDYKNNFIFHPSPNEMGDYWLPLISAATFLIAAPAVVLIVRRNRQALAPAVVALMTFLMATSLSKPLWDALPALQETQFPWRWLTITSAALSILVTISLPSLVHIGGTRLRPLSFALLGATVIGLSFTVFQVIRGARFQNQSTFNQMVLSLQGSETNKDFLPVWVSSKPRIMDQPVEVPGRDVQVVEWSGRLREFKIEAGALTEARLRTFYYPYWKATAEGKPLATRPADDGALLVSIPPAATTVKVHFVEPTSAYVAGALSVLGLLAIALSFADRAPLKPLRPKTSSAMRAGK